MSAEMDTLACGESNPRRVKISISDYVVSGANHEHAEIVVSLCLPAGSLSLSAGFYFTNGNFRCFAMAL